MATNDRAVFSPAENTIEKQSSQVPGYFRMGLGNYEVTALYDGFLSIGKSIYQGFTDLSEKELDTIICRQFQPLMPDGGVNTAVTGFLVNTGSNLVLIDAGAGNVYDDNLGRLTDNMVLAGYQPEEVDILIATHMHFDHVSGFSRDGACVFPNATVYLVEDESRFWLDTSIDEIPENSRQYVQWARDSVAPYLAAGKVEHYSLGDILFPGVRSIPSVGHTPGHSGIEVSSEGQRLLVWGDLVHNYALQLSHPEIADGFDVDPNGAQVSRRSLLADAADSDLWIAGAHLPFPGIGHVQKNGQRSYSWVPVEYTP